MPTRPRRQAGARAQELLDDAILERMKRDHGEPPARPEQPLGSRQTGAQLAKLIVEVDAKRLKRARRRMDGRAPRRHDRANELGELAGSFDGLVAAARDDGPGDAAGVAFLAVAADDVGERRLIGTVDDVAGRGAGGRHAHVERPVGLERKAAGRIIKL